MRTHLEHAITLAHEAAARGDRPFGAVLLSASGTVLAEGQNSVTTTGDIRAHAELNAIEAARLAGRAAQIPGGTMIASGEPCPMCAAAMIWAGITHITFAAAKPDIDAVLPDGPRINLRCADVTNASNTTITVEGPIDHPDALTPFYAYRRANSTPSAATPPLH